MQQAYFKNLEEERNNKIILKNLWAKHWKKVPKAIWTSFNVGTHLHVEHPRQKPLTKKWNEGSKTKRDAKDSDATSWATKLGGEDKPKS